MKTDPFTTFQQECRRYIKLHDQQQDLQIEDEKLQEKISDLELNILPKLMQQLEISDITIANRKIEMTQNVIAKLPKKDNAKREQTIQTLVESGHGGIVGRQIIINLPKGDAILEQQLLDAIKQVQGKHSWIVEYNIHHSTYSAHMRRLVEKGTELPLEQMGVFIQDKVTVDG